MRRDIAKIKPGRKFIITHVMKANQLSHLQPHTEVKDGKAIRTYEVTVNDVEDRGEYLYIGYTPTDRAMGAFGYTRVYKNDGPEYGCLGFEAKYNYQEA